MNDVRDLLRKETLDVEDLRRLGLLQVFEPRAGRTAGDLRLRDLEELPQARRDALVRNLLLNAKTAGGKIVVDGKPLDLETEAREILAE